MNSSQEFIWEYNCVMNSRDTLNNEITLQTIALSLENITKTLGNFATKKDIEKFATKDDMKSFATKKDLENSSKELDDLIGWLAATVKGELVRTEVRITDRIEILENKINELEQKVDRNHTYAVNQLDNILTHYARREEYNYYGERLKKLERKVFA